MLGVYGQSLWSISMVNLHDQSIPVLSVAVDREQAASGGGQPEPGQHQPQAEQAGGAAGQGLLSMVNLYGQSLWSISMVNLYGQSVIVLSVYAAWLWLFTENKRYLEEVSRSQANTNMQNRLEELLVSMVNQCPVCMSCLYALFICPVCG